jgi:hypothetical protein
MRSRAASLGRGVAFRTPIWVSLSQVMAMPATALLEKPGGAGDRAAIAAMRAGVRQVRAMVRFRMIFARQVAVPQGHPLPCATRRAAGRAQVQTKQRMTAEGGADRRAVIADPKR